MSDITLDLAESTWRAMLRTVALLERIVERLGEPLAVVAPPQVVVRPPEVRLPAPVVNVPAPVVEVPPPAAVDITPLIDRLDEIARRLERPLPAATIRGGSGNVRLVDSTGQALDLPRETGAWSYRWAALSGGQQLSAVGRCVGLWVVPVSTDPVVRVNGGDQITVPAGGFVLNPRAQLVDPQVDCVSGQVQAFVEVLS